jgi:hypothetical protein
MIRGKLGPSEDAWASRKAAIRRLYLFNEASLKELVRELASRDLSVT